MFGWKSLSFSLMISGLFILSCGSGMYCFLNPTLHGLVMARIYPFPPEEIYMFQE